MRKHLKWLNEQIDLWEQKSLIDNSTAQAIRHLYEYEHSSSNKVFLMIFAIIGALLIGGGIILLLAKNWDMLSKTTRTLIAFTPMIIAQILALFLILKRSPSLTASESLATFWSLALGACLAMISQIYHLSGPLDNFVLSWMLLLLPICYLLNAAMPTIFYYIGITIWLGDSAHSFDVIYFWLLFALGLPQVFRILKHKQNEIIAKWISLAVLTLFIIDFGLSIGNLFAIDGFWKLSFSLLFAAFYFAGYYYRKSALAVIPSPLEIAAFAGTYTIFYLSSFNYAWSNSALTFASIPINFNDGFPVEWINLFLLIMLLIVIGIAFFKKSPKVSALDCWFFFAPLLQMLLLFLDKLPVDSVLLVLAANLYILLFSVMILWQGAKNSQLSTMNLGSISLFILILTRFLDSDLSFTARGIAFIIIGTLFLISNLLIRKRIKGEEN